MNRTNPWISLAQLFSLAIKRFKSAHYLGGSAFKLILTGVLLIGIVNSVSADEEITKHYPLEPVPSAKVPTNVAQDGAFNYSIPINLPAFRGLEPKLSLLYNSSNKGRGTADAIMGVGWRLSGLSKIERVSSSFGPPIFSLTSAGGAGASIGDNGGGSQDFRDILQLDSEVLLACRDGGATSPWNLDNWGYPAAFHTSQPSASCSAGGNLATQVESFKRITRSGRDDGSARFEVRTPDGTVYSYSVPSAAPTDSYNNRHRRNLWLLTGIRDSQAVANSVSITYAFSSLSTGLAPRPSRIAYGDYTVDFYYEQLALPLSSFPGPALVGTQNFRLMTIAIRDNGTATRAYALTYASSARTGSSVLQSVREYGTDFILNGSGRVTGGSALPPYEFTYSSDTYSLTDQTFPSQYKLSSFASVWDFDDDQRMDIVVPNQYFPARDMISRTYIGPISIPKAHIGFGPNRTIKSLPTEFIPETFSDFLFGIKLNKAMFGLSSQPGPTGWKLVLRRNHGVNSNLGGASHFYRAFLDVVNASGQVASTTRIGTDTAYDSSGTWSFLQANSDSRPEVVFGEDESYDDFEYPVLQKVFQTTADQPVPLRTLPNVSQQTADLTGDGEVEFIEPLNEPPTSTMKITIRSGSSYVTVDRTLDIGTCTGLRVASEDTYQTFFGDLNGDGRDDLIVYHMTPFGSAVDKICVGLSDGEKFRPLSVWATLSDYFRTKNETCIQPYGCSSTPLPALVVSDFNDDGIGDLLLHWVPRYGGLDWHYRAYPGDAKIYLSNGSSLLPLSGAGIRDVFEYVVMGDFDGDGRTDFGSMRGYSSGGGMSSPAAPYQNGFPRGMRVYWGPSESPNLLKSVKVPEGGRLDVTYAPSSNFTGNYLPGVKQVVAQILSSDGRGNSFATAFSYVGGRFDFERRQPLGFRTVTAVLPPVAGEIEGPQVVTTYLNDHVAEYGLVKSRVMIQGGVTLSREIFDYEIQKVGNGPWRADRVSERRAVRYGNDLVENAMIRTYDVFGQVVRETSLGLSVDGVNIDPSDDVTVTLGYNRNTAAYIMDRASYRREEAGGASTAELTDDLSYVGMTYDGAASSATEPTFGNLTKIEEWTGTTSGLTLRVAKLLTYDPHGNVLTETDAKAAAAGEGPTVSYTYDTARQLFRLTTTNAFGQMEAVVWNTLCQAPATVTDPNSRVTSKTYDAFCRETRTDLPGGQYLVTRYVTLGTPALQHVEREARSGSVVSGRELSVSREYFDGLGRIWAKSQPGTNSAISDAVLQLSAYDARGNLAWTSLPLPFSALNTTPNAAQRTSFAYDGLNRALETILPDGSKRSLAYLTVSLSHYGGPFLAYPATRALDEHCFDAVAADTICGETVQIIDAAGRLIRSDRMDNALTDLDAGGQALRSTSFRYDQKGSLIGVTDPGGITFAYTYDTYGNRRTADDPGLGFWTLTYDANNNLLTQTDAKGQLISFAYDALNRVTLKTVGTGPARVETRFTYDEVRAGFFNIGRETGQEVWTPAGTVHKVERDWHLMGGLEVERHTIDGRTYALETSFAPNGVPLDQRLPRIPGTITTGWIGPFAYDAAGRVTAMAGFITSVSYDAWGQPTAAAYANGVTETYVYNPSRGWLTSIVGVLPNGDMAFRAAYDRSDTGRIFRVDTQAMAEGGSTNLGGSYDYTYDYTGRLVSAINWRGVTAFDQAFAYDRAGRLRAKGSTLATAMSYDYTDPLTPDHAPGAVTSGGVTTDFTYDANGNMLTGLGAKMMTYDGENRPLSITHLGKRTCYVYGVDGKRLKKVEGLPPTQDCTALPANASTTVYFGAVEVRNWLLAGEQVLTYPHPAVKLLNGTSPAVATYLHRDGLSSVRAITNAAGVKIEAAIYKPFGEQSEWVVPGNLAPETKGWIGERFDADAGLQYLNARYYDPELSLFLQPDWFEVTKAGVGTNRFSYSFNDPINKLDPGGNDAKTQRDELDEWERENDASFGSESYEKVRDSIDARRAQIAADEDPTNAFLNQHTDAAAEASLAHYTGLGGIAGPKVKAVSAGLAKGADAETRTTISNMVEQATSRSATVTAGKSIPFKEGVYEFLEGAATYVGQTGDLATRLAQHMSSGKIVNGSSVKVTEVLGGKTVREVFEHRRIQEITGGVPARFSDLVTNLRDPIGMARSYLLK
jgi:RHS repeat-associated protein